MCYLEKYYGGGMEWEFGDGIGQDGQGEGWGQGTAWRWEETNFTNETFFPYLHQGNYFLHF